MPPPPDDWNWKLAQQFLAGAVRCEPELCDRRFVTDRVSPEMPPPGCPCQLAVRVTETIAADKCTWSFGAEVVLTLDLCNVVAGPNEVPDVAKVNTTAQTQAAIRLAILKGLMVAKGEGALGIFVEEELGQFAPCGRITPGGWRALRSLGGMTRWESTWRWSYANL